MKFNRVLFLLLLVCTTMFSASAQDMIVKKNGTIIKAKVIKDGSSEVEYNKWTNQNGPIYSISVNELFAINYQNGEKDMFENNQNKTTQQKESINGEINSPKEIPAILASDNSILIKSYTNQVLQAKKPRFKEKQARLMYPVYGITCNSVLSDSHITISFSKVYTKYNTKYIPESVVGYSISIENKSDETIYIDLANSFKIDDMGNSISYFSNKTYTTNKSSSSGGSLNLGAVTGAIGMGGAVGTLANGVNVGGGSTKGTSVTETEERIMIIPPHGKRTLPLEKESTKKDIIEKPETFRPNKRFSAINIMLHQYKDIYTEENSPSKYRRIITYSTNPNFDTYTRLNVCIFWKGVLGEYHSSLKYLQVNDIDMQATDWKHLIVGHYTGTGSF